MKKAAIPLILTFLALVLPCMGYRSAHTALTAAEPEDGVAGVKNADKTISFFSGSNAGN